MHFYLPHNMSMFQPVILFFFQAMLEALRLCIQLMKDVQVPYYSYTTFILLHMAVYMSTQHSHTWALCTQVSTCQLVVYSLTTDSIMLLKATSHITLVITATVIYRIAGNFHGRKFSRIVGLGYFVENIFVVCSSEHVDWERDKHALHSEHEASGNDSRSFFADNIFADSNKNTKSVEDFHPRKFPAIRYITLVITQFQLSWVLMRQTGQHEALRFGYCLVVYTEGSTSQVYILYKKFLVWP